MSIHQSNFKFCSQNEWKLNQSLLGLTPRLDIKAGFLHTHPTHASAVSVTSVNIPNSYILSSKTSSLSCKIYRNQVLDSKESL